MRLEAQCVTSRLLLTDSDPSHVSYKTLLYSYPAHAQPHRTQTAATLDVDLSAPRGADHHARDISHEPYSSRSVHSDASHDHPLERRILQRDCRAYFLCGACRGWIGSRHIADPENLATFAEHYDSAVCKRRRNRRHTRPSRASNSRQKPLSLLERNSHALSSIPTQAAVAVAPVESHCPGIGLRWGPDPESEYLWHLHAQNSPVTLPWTWPRKDEQTGLFYTRSTRCTFQAWSSGPCRSCRSVSSLVDEKYASVTRNMPSMPDIYRPQAQLVPMVREQRRRVQVGKLQVCFL
jgi:hypothetical protein